MYHSDLFTYTNISDERLVSHETTDLHYKVIKGEKKYSKIFIEPNAKILEFFRGTSFRCKH